MILIISGIVLVVGILLFLLAVAKNIEPLFVVGFLMCIFSIIFGFLLLGCLVSVETTFTIPEDAFIEKNKNSIVLVVPNIGNKVITDPAIIRHIEISDTIKVRKNYNSYGFQVENTKIYVEKNGWKY